ncbi:MAG TPA: radical SAM protein, partial [Candidatus Limnocylindrales bacterium]|nr:radical SAM protein [Candidatus Limnocylindrales bacterium]
IGAVHIDTREENGLERECLKAAAAAGMVRLTTGLESGSQRILDLMEKGTDLERTERTLREAAEAGIGVRVTMIVGYPGEEPEDVERSAAFLERNAVSIERVLLNRFAIIVGTRVHRRLKRRSAGGETLEDLRRDDAAASVHHRYGPAGSRPYRRALWRLLGAVHGINRRAIGVSSLPFEGVM